MIHLDAIDWIVTSFATYRLRFNACLRVVWFLSSLVYMGLFGDLSPVVIAVHFWSGVGVATVL